MPINIQTLTLEALGAAGNTPNNDNGKILAASIDYLGVAYEDSATGNVTYFD